MKFANQKFLKVLGVLSKKEIEGFALYLNSPFAKLRRKEKSIEVFNKLMKVAIFETKNPETHTVVFLNDSVEKICKKLFGTVNDDGNKAFSLCLSYLYKALQSFLSNNVSSEIAIKTSSKEPFQKLFFLEFLQNRQLYNVFNIHFKEYKEELEGLKKSEDLYLIEQQLELLNIQQQILEKKTKHKIDTSNLFKLNARFSLLHSLRLSCTHKNLCYARNVEHHEIPNNIIYSNFDEQVAEFNDDVLIQLFHKAYLAFEKKFDHKNLFSKIKKHYKCISIEATNRLIKYVESIALEGIREGFDKKNRLLLQEVNEFLVDKNILIQNNSITNRNFLNIVNQAAKTNKFDWGHNFIDKHKIYLAKKDKEKISNTAKSLLFFENKEFDKTIDILDHPNMHFENDSGLENNRRTIIIRAYYENNQFSDLYYQIERYLSYLRKSSNLPKAHNQLNKVFLQHLKKLIKVKEIPLDKISLNEKLKKLEQNILSKKMNHKQWLLEKINLSF